MPRHTHPDWRFVDILTKGHYDQSGKYQHNLTDADLGAGLRAYLRENQHVGWDGFTNRDQTGIRRFLVDLALYIDNQ